MRHDEECGEIGNKSNPIHFYHYVLVNFDQVISAEDLMLENQKILAEYGASHGSRVELFTEVISSESVLEKYSDFYQPGPFDTHKFIQVASVSDCHYQDILQMENQNRKIFHELSEYENWGVRENLNIDRIDFNLIQSIEIDTSKSIIVAVRSHLIFKILLIKVGQVGQL